MLVAGLMFLIAYRVPKRLEDGLILKHVSNKCVFVLIPPSHVFLFPSSQNLTCQCAVTNTGKKKGKKSGLWSAESNPCSTLISLQHKKRAVDIRVCSVRDGSVNPAYCLKESVHVRLRVHKNAILGEITV